MKRLTEKGKADVALLDLAIKALMPAVDHDEASVSSPAEDALGAFRNMRIRLASGAQSELTERQRLWASDIADEPTYENLASSGKLNPGLPSQATPVPYVLRRPLPMKPPGRR